MAMVLHREPLIRVKGGIAGHEGSSRFMSWPSPGWRRCPARNACDKVWFPLDRGLTLISGAGALSVLACLFGFPTGTDEDLGEAIRLPAAPRLHSAHIAPLRDRALGARWLQAAYKGNSAEPYLVRLGYKGIGPDC
jgi:hypothetical protein